MMFLNFLSQKLVKTDKNESGANPSPTLAHSFEDWFLTCFACVQVREGKERSIDGTLGSFTLANEHFS